MKQSIILGGVAVILFLLAAPSFLSNPYLFAADTAPVGSSFYYQFKVDGMLAEAGSMQESWSPYWWLNSGAKFFLKDGIGKTVQGELSWVDPWRLYYNSENPLDTDQGFHPQNIFRLVTRSTWQNIDQRVRFRITEINMSESPERDAWSGVLLFNRYQDGNNLYYAGVRVDGNAVIKKKINGQYYTLALERVFDGDASYERDTNPNLVPGERWLGLRSIVQTEPNGAVRIELYVDRHDTGDWELVAQAKDAGMRYGGAPILKRGFGGIRTDFMDVEFDDYRAIEL